VGALSVALAVGAAIASMPAVAFADETGSGGSTGSSSSGSSSGASSEGAGASPSTSSESSPSGGSSAGSDSGVSSEVDTSDIDVDDVDVDDVDVSDVDVDDVDVSDVDASEVDASEVDVSDVDTPTFDVSDVDTPTFDVSDVDAPDVDTPTIDASDVDASEVDASDVDTPTTRTSGVSGSGGASDWVSGPRLTAPRGVWRGVAHADRAQDNVANFNELSRQAEQLIETVQAAQLDLDTKLQLQSEADKKHADDLAALDAAKAQLAPRQAAIDKLAATDYMGAGTEGFSAAASPQRFIDKLTIQRVMATTMSEQLQSAHQVEQEAQTIEAASAKSAADAKAAADAASVVRADLQKKQSQLQTQVALVKASDGVLSPAMQAVLGPGAAIPTVGMRGLVPNARALTAYIIATYPGVQSIGGARADPLPDHPSGRAIDIMTGSDVSLGDAINADVQSQAGRFGVTYTMWRVSAHFDHIHVTVS